MVSSWQPVATLDVLRRRAHLNALIRARFAAQQVLEVETPVLGRSSCLDPQVPSFELGTDSGPRWLQTSPENHMKRLLAAGSGPIYRLGPVFRSGENGRWHSPEFTLLEWYRPGFTDRELMADVAELVAELGGPTEVSSARYGDLIQQQTGLDMHQCPLDSLQDWCTRNGLTCASQLDRDALLDFIMGVHVGPTLGASGLEFVVRFPASQAALARLDPVDPSVACRFELYWQGVELANGFYELSDVAEQGRRFAAESAQRAQAGLPAIPVDQDLLDALEHGLPEVSGVALGVDRLYALLLNCPGIAPVQSFVWDNA